MNPIKTLALLFLGAAALTACETNQPPTQATEPEIQPYTSLIGDAERAMYTTVRLTTATAALTPEDRKLIPLLIEAGKIMDELFWLQSWGDREALLSRIQDEETRTFAAVNYGPWNRLNNNASFIQEIGEKPAGAQFYPADMTKEEFEAWENPHKTSLYTLIRRDEQGKLFHQYYHEAYSEQVTRVAQLLREAAGITENESFKFYLEERARAFETDRYNPSDIAWLNLTGNHLDVILGPIETYEDQLFGFKAAHECYILVKDLEWSQRLERYAALLPRLQKELPCDQRFKQDQIGSNAQLNAYDVIFYAGDCNAGSKTIAVNLPNDEEIQQQHGTRRSQLKNAMRAKFDKILVPIADALISEDQRKHITFDAFFGNTMFHEVAHGLGVKNTVNGKGLVREALKEQASALEEGKADILGLWMVTRLFELGEINDGEVMDNYVTFLAGIFRSVRFGASSAHGKANMLRFNYFAEQGAFVFDNTTQTYAVDFGKMKAAVESLSALILKLQGEGDYEGVVRLMDEKGNIGEQLAADLARINAAGIPVDVILEQGTIVVGIE